jgi:hypothetical protein
LPVIVHDPPLEERLDVFQQQMLEVILGGL